MSRRLEQLAPLFAVKVRAFLGRCAQAGYPLLVIRTDTDDAIQAALYAIGRARLTPAQETLLRNEGLYPEDQSRVRTHARTALETAHGLGLGIDVIPLKGGKPWWAAPREVWLAVYSLADECGLDAYGDPEGAYLPSDKGHFEERGWTVFRDLRLAAGATEGSR